jgi:hypothetical protein
MNCKYLERGSHGLFEVLSQYSPVETEENPKTSIIIALIRSRIEPNASLEYQSWNSLIINMDDKKLAVSWIQPLQYCD